jgi:sortase A
MSNQNEESVPKQQIPVERPELSTTATQCKGTRVWRRIESVLLFSGLAFLMVYGCARTHSELMSQAGLWSFKAQKSAARSAKEVDPSGQKVDFRRWSAKRVKAYTQALSAKLGVPLAVLSIPRLGLEVPVFEGTDDLTLNRGAGRIAGTAIPGEQGNIGIAAHRDGFFRCLKEVKAGDRIELATLHHKLVYTVDSISVVNPSDVAVLQARPQPSLTLVTCYPFYLVGDAPQRYIVQASLMDSGKVDSGKVGSEKASVSELNQQFAESSFSKLSIIQNKEKTQ